MKTCPWYYEEVDKFIQGKKATKKWRTYSIESLLGHVVDAKTKKRCFTRFKKDY